MPGGSGRRTSTSFEAMNTPSGTGISKLVIVVFKVSPIVYDPLYNFHLLMTFEASNLGAASTARACSRVALKYNTNFFSANTNTFKLASYENGEVMVAAQRKTFDKTSFLIRKL